jgi:hypothetical protein
MARPSRMATLRQAQGRPEQKSKDEWRDERQYAAGTEAEDRARAKGPARAATTVAEREGCERHLAEARTHYQRERVGCRIQT